MLMEKVSPRVHLESVKFTHELEMDHCFYVFPSYYFGITFEFIQPLP